MRFSLYDSWAGPRVIDKKNNLLGFVGSKKLDAIKKDLDNGADINMMDEYGNGSALHIASSNNWLEGVEYLVSQGANINLQDSNGGYTALMRAAQEGNLEVVKYLIFKGANANIKNIYGNTALKMALNEWHLEVVSFLIANNVMCSDNMAMQLASYLESNGINIKDEKQIMSDKGTLLMAKFVVQILRRTDYYIGLLMASLKGYYGAANFLAELFVGKLDYIRDRFDQTALCYASENGHLKIVRLLVEYGADVNKTDEKARHIPLLYASRNGHFEVVKYLVEHGADVNIKDGDGHTALMESCCVEISKYLISQGAYINMVDVHKSWNALRFALDNKAFDVAEYYLSIGLDIDSKDVYGGSALITASNNVVYYGFETIKFLVEHGADVNVADRYGWTALMCVIKSSFPAAKREMKFETIKFLVEHGADVNAKCNSGLTVLMYAVRYSLHSEVEVIKFLLEHGADVNAIDKQGNNVLSMDRHYLVERCLIEAGAKE